MELENTAIRLKKLMQERKLRQVDLLEMLRPLCEKYNVKINKSDISQYLSGKVKPGQEKLSMIGMALNINEAWLMGYDVPKEKPHYIKTLSLTKEETTLLENYNKLNDLGKKEANKRVAELTEINIYISKGENNIIELSATKEREEYNLAAHDDNLDSETAKRNLNKAKEIFKQMDEE
ncbi:DNA-binding protein [Clostridium botulinum]|nr:DNA-binding protein [Clostridium botulinum]MBY6915593.1 DNA-binding protein [Clostridium botulinum]NFO39864.1 DNA-binding protein [Clostridium botulinum]NFO48174.1 DNA-binding protein [Clostridium botulinum]NFQ39822.1 DNA-binding protein [Clostridium botulinum]